MPHADTQSVAQHDDTRTEYTDVTYRLHRDEIRVWTAGGEQIHADVLMTQAYRASTATTDRAGGEGPR